MLDAGGEQGGGVLLVHLGDEMLSVLIKARGRGVLSPFSSRLARSMVISRRGGATWIAASPMPGASYMVSNMSSASLRISAVPLKTGLETSRNCLSGRMMISRIAMMGRFKLLFCRGQCAAEPVKAALTMIFKAALTTKIKG